MAVVLFFDKKYIWKCSECGTKGKKATSWSEACDLFTAHVVKQQRKHFWDCEFETEEV